MWLLAIICFLLICRNKHNYLCLFILTSKTTSGQILCDLYRTLLQHGQSHLFFSSLQLIIAALVLSQNLLFRHVFIRGSTVTALKKFCMSGRNLILFLFPLLAGFTKCHHSYKCSASVFSASKLSLFATYLGLS